MHSEFLYQSAQIPYQDTAYGKNRGGETHTDIIVHPSYIV